MCDFVFGANNVIFLGDISQYKCCDSVLASERFLARIRLILKTIQEQNVLEDIHYLLKIVVEEETKTGELIKHRKYSTIKKHGYFQAMTKKWTENRYTDY